MKARRVDHVCIAVRNLAEARRVYEETLGLELICEYVSDAEKIHVARYRIGEVALEIMQPTAADGEVAKFLGRRGEGVFLIAYGVADVQEGLAELRARGEKTIDAAPRSLKGNRYAFIQPPARLCGVLTEIVDGEFDPSA
jgi:methylmalonyl-CoA/ethylmalonyl-CoA epimerase